MNNINFLNVCYKYINGFINIDELLDSLSKSKKKEIKDLVNEIKNSIKDISNEEDEFVTRRKENIRRQIEGIEKLIEVSEDIDDLTKTLNNLKEEYNKKLDSKELWEKVLRIIINNEYFSNAFDNISKHELLEIITKYIKAPLPPDLSNEEFMELVQICIDEDEREWLWRLAFNYEDKNYDLNPIADYYILKNDGYYLVELISAVGEHLDIDRIIYKANDKELVKYLVDHYNIIEYFVNKKQIDKLKKKLD